MTISPRGPLSLAPTKNWPLASRDELCLGMRAPPPGGAVRPLAPNDLRACVVGVGPVPGVADPASGAGPCELCWWRVTKAPAVALSSRRPHPHHCAGAALRAILGGQALLAARSRAGGLVIERLAYGANGLPPSAAGLSCQADSTSVQKPW